MPRTSLDHTADSGIEATAPTLPALIEELATGMFELMAPVEPCPAASVVETTVTADSVEDLVVDSLSDLLYLAEIEDLHLCRFDVEGSGLPEVRIRAQGIPIAGVEASGPPIKAVTYHRLEATETEEGWYGRVYFDV
jgi:SHS2 domain-containing protein